MKILFLGTGTSTGVPVIGCDCPVCKSENPKNNRLRTSIYLESDNIRILVDASPDLRQQALRYGVRRIDAVLFTHAHADHVFGFDDIRRFNTIQGTIIPAYGIPETIRDLKRIFDYVESGDEKKGSYRPRINFAEINGPFYLGNIEIVPIAVKHQGPALGYLFEENSKKFGYFPDCLGMDEDAVEKLKNIDVMVIDALRYRPHATHMTVDESVILLKKIGAKKSFLIHMCHDLEHEELEAYLPDRIGVAYDGMILEL
mgnify:CR=1 FL=1